MKQVLIKHGRALATDVPAPHVAPGCVLVRVRCSCISSGTEMAHVSGNGMPLWKKAMQKPDKVKKVLQMARTEGVSYAWQRVAQKLEAGEPEGYSAAGEVVALGDGVTAYQVGDRVACAGAQCAFHAETICVPQNLVVPIPAGVSYRDAAPVTLGSIALQGVRRAETTLGETFVVIGLGVIGQIAVQLLKASGCRVIVSDLDQGRIDMALAHGADLAIAPDGGADLEQVRRLTGGFGADGVIITAASRSSAIVSTAFRMCRRKGRVVLVGAVGLDLNREDFYKNELDFRISTSYGPGRYDEGYEEKGHDYPIGYVRWTENRNLREVLALVAQGKLRFADMVSHVYPIDEAEAAYESLQAATPKPLMVLLEYPESATAAVDVIGTAPAKPADGRIEIALIGAGGFAKGMHLPNLTKLKDRFRLRAVMSRTGANAEATARQYGADYATTSYDKILADGRVQAVLITTRHNLHARMALEALRAGKHVLVEKPLALTGDELAEIEAFFQEKEAQGEAAPVLLTGFNRRWSRYLRAIMEATKDRAHPMIVNYRMNAGYLPQDHWTQTEEGGGRNLGEATHIYDVFSALTGAHATAVSAHAIHPQDTTYGPRDNFVATVTYDDGSVCTLTYTALGAKDFPKEQMDVYCDGAVYHLDDYKSLTACGTKMKPVTTQASDKGQLEELAAFGKAIREGAGAPTPVWQQLQDMRVAFAVEESI